MSEYQYYEFLAVDRPLDPREQEELRDISTRARITASSFTNHYEWGDLKADPARLLERYFDLFLYLANWGSRRFAMRLPRGLMEPGEAARFAIDEDYATVRVAGDHLIVDMYRDEIEPDYDEWDDGPGWLGALSPLRAAVLNGDLRLFYLVWLMAVEDGYVDDAAAEPLPGIGPLTASMRAFAEFFAIDGDLVDVAAQGEPQAFVAPPREDVVAYIRSLADEEKTALLLRLYDDDPHVGIELRRACRPSVATATLPRRTAGELCAAAQRIADERHRRAKVKAAAERRREEAARAKKRAAYLTHLAERGEGAWREVEERIMARNPAGYDRAADLLVDLREIAEKGGRAEEFAGRLAAILDRHARKGRFVERLRAAGLG